MNIRKVLISDFEDILRLQLQLEDTEIVFDDNLVSHCYDTEEGRKKLESMGIKRENALMKHSIELYLQLHQRKYI